MAKVYLLPDHKDFELVFDLNDMKSFDATVKKQFALSDELHADPFARYANHMDAPDGIIGSIISFGVADGKAEYLVMRKKPLTLCWIPNPDGYEADDCTTRGVNWSYVKSRASADRLFPRKQFPIKR